MMKIDISYETAESFMRDMLIADYRNIRNMMYDHLNETVETGEYNKRLHPEDYEFYKELFAAIKVYMRFYLNDEKREAILAE